MPVSTSIHISHAVALIGHLNPRSVLDVGCGFGMWGFLCRMYLDISAMRVQPADWRVRIDGLELFEPYIQAHHRTLYNNILIGDIRERAASLEQYELIIAGDVIEHLEKDEGKQVLRQLYDKAQRALLVNIPLGEGWEHPEAHGNPGELHRSQWYPEDFLPYPSSFTPFKLPCGDYGVFYCPKDCGQEAREAGLLAAAEHAQAQGHAAEALEHIRLARSVAPGSLDAIFLLADLLIQQARPGEAAEELRAAWHTLPERHEIGLLLAKLLCAQARGGRPGAAGEARDAIEALLARPGLPETNRAEAEALRTSLT